jgi:hypothetical protein
MLVNVNRSAKLGLWHREGVKWQIGEEQKRAGENSFMSCNLHPVFLRQRDRGEMCRPKELIKSIKYRGETEETTPDGSPTR